MARLTFDFGFDFDFDFDFGIFDSIASKLLY
jgi:hypothetical protein